MSRNYKVTPVPAEWYTSRETHPAVASAIFALADKRRTPEAIWEAPTTAEFDHVRMAVREYLTHSDFTPASDNLYEWGAINIAVENPNWDT